MIEIKHEPGLRVGDVLAPKKGCSNALFVALGSEPRALGLDAMRELHILCDDIAFSNDFSGPMPLGLVFKAQAWWLEEHLRRWDKA